MKKTTIILTITLSILTLGSSALKATQAEQISELMYSISFEFVQEKDIQLDPWMYSNWTTDNVARESELEVKNWMLDPASWENKSLTEEPEMDVQDWMIRNFEKDNSIALEEWMTRNFG